MTVTAGTVEAVGAHADAWVEPRDWWERNPSAPNNLLMEDR